jgi:protein gp37
MNETMIEYVDMTWNPVTGCTKLSTGCAHCYAETLSLRLRAMGVKKYANGFCPTVHEETLSEPLKWKKPHTIFVCSMADLFHDSVTFGFIDSIMEIIKLTPYHRYQILTKRVERMAEYFKNKSIHKNIWLGVTIEAKETINRIDTLRKLSGTVHFLSCEPLIDDIGAINLTNIQWVIVGGESGNYARPMKIEWVRSLQQQAKEQKVAFFFKQWGTWGSDGVKRNKKLNGKLIDGKIIQTMPIFVS